MPGGLMEGTIPVAKDHPYNNGLGGNELGIGGNGIDFPIVANMEVIPQMGNGMWAALDEKGEKIFEMSHMLNGIKGGIASEIKTAQTPIGTSFTGRGIG